MSTSALAIRHKWSEVVRRQRESGLSVAEFCRREKVSAVSLYVWRRRLGGGGALAGFVEAKVMAGQPVSGGLLVCLRGGRRLLLRRGFDRELLAEAVAVLEGLA